MITLFIEEMRWQKIQEIRLRLLSEGTESLAYGDSLEMLKAKGFDGVMWAVYGHARIAGSVLVARAEKKFRIEWDLKTDVWFGPVIGSDRFAFRYSNFTLEPGEGRRSPDTLHWGPL